MKSRSPSTRNTPVSSVLSAIGSINAPNFDVQPNRRARVPSMVSVMPERKKRIKAVSRSRCQMLYKMTGVAHIRKTVRTLGIWRTAGLHGQGGSRRHHGLFQGEHFIERGILHDAVHERGVHGVTGAFGDDAAEERAADEGQVTDQVQDFVAAGLVLKPQPAGIQYFVGCEAD